jgi:hypothetical protein
MSPRAIRDGRIPIRISLEPDLVVSGSLTVESETQRLELSYDLPIPKASEAAYQAATTIV